MGIYAGMGCLDVGPALACAAEILQAPVATSVSGKGAIPDRTPARRRLGLWRPGDPGGRESVQGSGHRPRRRGQVQRELDGQLRHPQARQGDPRRRLLGQPRQGRAGLRRGQRRLAALLRSPDPGRRGDPSAGEPRPGQADRTLIARSTAARTARSRSPRASTRCSFLLQLRCALGPDELIFVDVTAASHWAAEAIDLSRPEALFHAGQQSEHGMGDPGGPGGPEGPARPGRGVDLGGRLLPDVGPGDVDRRPGLDFRSSSSCSTTVPIITCRCSRSRPSAGPRRRSLARVDFAAFAAAMGLAYNVIAQNAELPQGMAKRDRPSRADPDPGRHQLRGA